MVRGFIYRFVGVLWLLLGLLIILVSLAYIIAFGSIVGYLTGELGDMVPLVNWIAAHFRPGWLQVWGVLLGAFLILMGGSLSTLSPAVRRGAMSFHLLLGIYLIGVVLSLFYLLDNNLIGTLAIPSRILFVFTAVGLSVGLGMLGLGAALNTRGSRNLFIGLSPSAAASLTQASTSIPQLESYLESGGEKRVRAVYLTSMDTNEVYEVNLLDRTTIGRASNRDIQLDESSVSSKHAHIDVVDDRFLLYDNASVNGTYVNGQRQRYASLKSGDEVQFGRNRFRFEIEYDES